MFTKFIKCLKNIKAIFTSYKLYIPYAEYIYQVM